MKKFFMVTLCVVSIMILGVFSASAAIIFQEDFESYADNAALTAAWGTNTLTGLSTLQAKSGTQSAADLTCTTQGVLTKTGGTGTFYNTNDVKLTVSYWFYDSNGAGPGCTGSATLNGRAGLSFGRAAADYMFVGAYHANSVTNYVARVMAGGGAWQVTTAPRSIGWQKFTITMGNGTINFYHNDGATPILTNSFTTADSWGTFVRFGSPAGGPYMDAYYDDLVIEAVANPVLVDDGGTGDFTRLVDAIASFAVGGSNAALPPPFTINIKAGSGPYCERITLNDGFTTGALVGDLTIQSDTPGTRVPLALLADARYYTPETFTSSAGLDIYQNVHDITLRDLLIYPCTTPGERFRRYIIKIDENSANDVFNTITFDNCIITEVGTDGEPLITSRAQAYDPPRIATGSLRTGSAFANTLQWWGDAGESLNVVLQDCVLYGAPPEGYGLSANHLRATLVGQHGESLTIKDTLMAYGPAAAGVRFGSNGQFQGTVDIDGLEVYNSPQASANHCMTVEGTTAVTDRKSTGTIINSKFVRDINTDTVTRGFSGGGALNVIEMDKVIIVSPGPGLVDVNTGESKWTNLTVHNNSAGGSNAFYLVGGAGSLEVTNAIFSGPGNKIAGTAPTGGLSIDCSAFPEYGPDAIGARDDGAIAVSYGSKITIYDPRYVSYDIDNAEFMDVDDGGYVDAACGDLPLGGGANYKGSVTEVTDWFLF